MARTYLLLAGLLLVSITLHTQVEADHHHFVLVHGIGHGGWCWYKITTLLQNAGHQVTAIDLASNGISKVVADNVTSIAQYVQPLTQFLANNVSTPNKVILVGHSLGGSAITYAMELFSQKIDKAIFLAAFMPKNNDTFIPAYVVPELSYLFTQGVFIQNFANGPTNPPTSISINLALVRQYFYNESPLKDVNLAKALLNPTPAAPINQVLNLTASNYGSIKRYYIKTDIDRAIPPAVQNQMIQNNPPNGTLFIPLSDHSAFFSKPILLFDSLLSIASY